MKKVIWLVISSLIILSLLLTSCGGEEEETEATVPEETPEVTIPEEKPEVTPPEVAKEWWDKWGEPIYGGILTIRGSERSNWDPYYNGYGPWWYETVAMRNFADIDHEIFDFKLRFSPIDYYTGKLAESWDIEAWDTFVFHIRKGIHWQNKPPMNGRELDAYDMMWSWHRMCGLGSGFTEASPYAGMWRMISSVTATDKYTLVFKTSEPSLYQLGQLLDDHYRGSIVPREAVELWGDVNDWTRVIGTGPFMPTDYVSGVAMTTERNPNYWAYDEHYPDNRLPYIDGFKYMIIPDDSTARAALRTGKLDWLGGISWEHMGMLLEQRPELMIEEFPTQRGGTGIMFHIDTKPFEDIRVRKAMQMSIDLQTIADTYFGGMVDGTPPGYIGTPGFSVPYDEWPQEVKDGYAYNPEGARQLLAEAGYPDGLKLTMAISSSSDLDLAQIIQSYFADAGIDLELNSMEPTVFEDFANAGKLTMSWSARCYNIAAPPINAASLLTPYHRYHTRHNIDDPVYNDIYERMSSTFDIDEQRSLAQQADLYAVSNHLVTIFLPRFSYSMLWPWVKGYNGEMSANSEGQIYARLWIDEDLKKSMGY